MPLLFMRIHKTGSEALEAAIKPLFAPEEVAPYFFEWQVMSAPVEELRRYRFFSGHISPAAIRERLGEVTTFTVLREPHARLVSAYAHWHWYGARVPELPPLFRRIGKMSLEEFLTAQETQLCVQDVQWRLLNGGRFGANNEERILVSETIRPENFMHIGRTDRLSESARAVAGLLGRSAPEVNRINEAKWRPEVSARAHSLIAAATQRDAEVYAAV